MAGVSSVYAKSSNGVELKNAGSVSYTLMNHSIGSNKDWSGVTSTYNKIIVSADRHGSDKPATFFLKGLGPANVMGNSVWSHQTPEKLNFAIQGNLTMNVDAITVTCTDIRVGQGNNGMFENNWWVGGANCVGGNKAYDELICSCNNGALVKFVPGDNSHSFEVSVENPCDIISERKGYWMPVTAAEGQEIGYSFTSSSTQYTEESFMESLTAGFSVPFEFGSLELSAEESHTYVTQITHTSEWSKTCAVTVPTGQRLWQWTFGVDRNCDSSTMNSCYFFYLPIDSGPPCCLAGYQSTVRENCTEPGKNMCGSSPDGPSPTSSPTPQPTAPLPEPTPKPTPAMTPAPTKKGKGRPKPKAKAKEKGKEKEKVAHYVLDTHDESRPRRLSLLHV
jgi:hypothetical protein